MDQGFVKVASVTPDLRVADVKYNCECIGNEIKSAKEKGARIIVFPELCLTGATCGDLFGQEILLKEAKKALSKLKDETKGYEGLAFVGLPLAVKGSVYNVCAALSDGKILGFTTKENPVTYENNSWARQFSKGNSDNETILFDKEEVLIGSKMIYRAENMPDLSVAVLFEDDLQYSGVKSEELANAGAVVFAVCAASPERIGRREYKKEWMKIKSGELKAAMIYANAGNGESTTDSVYSGLRLIAENKKVLAESDPFENGMELSEIDVFQLASERQKSKRDFKKDIDTVLFKVKEGRTTLTRKVKKSPFIPENAEELKNRCRDIFLMQAMGLKKRLEHAHAATAVVGISGGLDSTLALLVTTRAFELMEKDKKDMIAVTMPCYGTTNRTYQNACLMSKKTGATLLEVPIAKAVDIHFEDIGHEKEVHDVTYENSQARERTQVLMDIANERNGMVIGTGDLSELALGWATYNGDHMSMYGVNGAVPKTLVRHLVKYYAMNCADEELKTVLLDVLDTPVSPELLPPKDGAIAQKTEDLVGPYELHDFYLFYLLRYGFTPSKVYRLACYVFEGEYDKETILKWLKTFCRRFFVQQFKRSCIPDGPGIGSVSISPRGSFMMPSDACSQLWLADLENVK